jgi:FtsZ-interacting cell division protein ZipA
MTSLQLGLIIGGVVLVVGVLIYNWVLERRIRRKITAAFRKTEGRAAPAATSRNEARVEPTLAAAVAGDVDARIAPRAAPGPEAVNAPFPETNDADDDFVPPVNFAPQTPADLPASNFRDALPAASEPAPATFDALKAATGDRHVQPDHDIECVITLQPVRPVTAGALAAALHARVGKPLRWFGRAGPDAAWHILKSDTVGEWRELVACLLLADRAGAATRPLIERFIRLVADQAAALPAAFVAPDPQAEVTRAEALDRLCADLDVQIGLTVLKTGPATIPGTRLRGVAEAAGFQLADSGRFEWIHEDSGAVLYALQNYRAEPFTVDSLRLTSTPGAVFLLDVPRVADPVRVFDQMKLAAKRMTQTLDAALVDDNRRPLDDAALAAIRQQVQATAAALKAIRVDPGSPRALALFGG